MTRLLRQIAYVREAYIAFGECQYTRTARRNLRLIRRGIRIHEPTGIRTHVRPDQPLYRCRTY